MASHEDREKYQKKLSKRITFGAVGPHESIYKYISLDGKQSWNYLRRTLAQNELIGATLNSLNDPLEGRPRIFDDLSFDVYERCCLYFDKDGVQRDERNFSDNLPFEDVQDHVLQRLNTTKERSRILSFARRSDSHLLWSHYANSHKGACLHFNLSAFTSELLTVGSVSYSLYRPVVPLSLMARLSLPPSRDHHEEDRKRLRSEIYRSLFYTKPLDWSYEEEIRLIYSTANMTNVPFESGGLYEVIVGARCSDEDRTTIVDIVRDLAPEVTVRSARLSEDTFNVEIE